MTKTLLIYSANAEIAEKVLKWKRKNSHLGDFVDLMTLGEPVDIFATTDRPYLSFLKLQIQRRALKYSVIKAIIFASKYCGRKSVGELNIPNRISYDLSSKKDQVAYEYAGKSMLDGLVIK